MTVMNIATIYNDGLKEYEKAEELYQRALKGYEAQLGKDHDYTKDSARNFRICLKLSGNSAGLEALKAAISSGKCLNSILAKPVSM